MLPKIILPKTISAPTRRFLLVAPLIVMPFCCLIFYMLGGGGHVMQFSGAMGLGLNTQLPKAHFDPRKAEVNKLGMYEQAERDSARRQAYERLDPYKPDSLSVKGGGAGVKPGAVGPPVVKMAPGSMEDPRAGQLLEQLKQMQASVHRGRQADSRLAASGYWPEASVQRERLSSFSALRHDDSAKDPRIERVNALLDKVIRIQHPEEGKPGAFSMGGSRVDDVLPADSSVNTIAAMVPEDQELTAGATIALRIMDSIRVDGRVVPGGQLVYGVVSVNNDRMLIHIGSLRLDRDLFVTDLQVYDLDGLAGIHIPGVLGRDVAKQSADQGINSLNVMPPDPTLGAQAASAGIQAAKTFLGRKVRQVRVEVRAGYQVLLRPARERSGRRDILFPDAKSDVVVRPPGFVPGGPILKHCGVEGVALALRDMRMEGDCLWFGLEWSNHSAIAYSPAYLRWFIRDRRVFKRSAVQELVLEPVSAQELPMVPSDSTSQTWTGFRPFSLPKGEELVLEAGEKNGGRVLMMVLSEKLWSTIKKETP